MSAEVRSNAGTHARRKLSCSAEYFFFLIGLYRIGLIAFTRHRAGATLGRPPCWRSVNLLCRTWNSRTDSSLGPLTKGAGSERQWGLTQQNYWYDRSYLHFSCSARVKHRPKAGHRKPYRAERLNNQRIFRSAAEKFLPPLLHSSLLIPHSSLHQISMSITSRKS